MVPGGRKLYYLPFSILMVSLGVLVTPLYFFFVFVFVVMDSCQVRIGLPCDDNSINTNIISAKNVKIFAHCDVANIWMEWMIMS